MQNRQMKSILASLVGSLCLTAAAYAVTAASASGSSATGATSATGSSTSGQTGSAAGSPASNPSATGTGTEPSAGATMKYSDDEIAALDLCIDDNEIKAAQVAEKKKMGKDAMRLAKMLLKQHREDSTKVSKLAKKISITPAESAAKVQQLRDKGAAELQTMAAKDSMEFEQAYITAMVQGHTEALALFDEHLVKDATNPKLKKAMEEARKHVDEHLEHAKRLQGARASR